MKSPLAFALAPVALVALLAGATAASAAPAGATLSGSCTLTGTVRFDPPLTTTAQPITSTADATGTCSGTLTPPDGPPQSLSNSPLRYHATEYTTSSSCNAAVDSGSGHLTVAGFTFPFAVDEDRASGAAVLRITGTEGGSALADARVDPSANPATIVSECAGSGLSQAPIDGDLQTTLPLVSTSGSSHAVRDDAADSHSGVQRTSATTPASSGPANVVGLPLTSSSAAAGVANAAGMLALVSVPLLRRRFCRD